MSESEDSRAIVCYSGQQYILLMALIKMKRDDEGQNASRYPLWGGGVHLSSASARSVH